MYIVREVAVVFQTVKAISVRDAARCLHTDTTEINISNTQDVLTKVIASFHAIYVTGMYSFIGILACNTSTKTMR